MPTTTTTARPRIFLSYAHADLAFARQLRERLIGEGLDPSWHDQIHTSAGQWWNQIETALTSPACQHVVLVLSVAALADGGSLAAGKNVIPVEAPGGLSSDDRRLMSKWCRPSMASASRAPTATTNWRTSTASWPLIYGEIGAILKLALGKKGANVLGSVTEQLVMVAGRKFHNLLFAVRGLLPTRATTRADELRSHDENTRPQVLADEPTENCLP